MIARAWTSWPDSIQPSFVSGCYSLCDRSMPKMAFLRRSPAAGTSACGWLGRLAKKTPILFPKLRRSLRVFLGKEVTGEIGHSWRQGRLEYGAGLVPIFWQLRPQTIYGGGFEPVILRWNSSLHVGRVAPYIELAGGGLRTNANLPAGDTDYSGRWQYATED